MITTTYLLVAAALAVGAWWLAGRPPRPRPGAALTRSLRAFVGGVTPDDDLVGRLADCLAEHTTVFGSSYAIPGHLGAELPAGVHDAASSVLPRLTDEVLDRYVDLMQERHHRLGRPDFVLPVTYALRLTLSRGTNETLVASFDPLEPGGAGDASDPDVDELTTRRAARTGGGTATLTLRVGDVLHGQVPVGPGRTTVEVGRGRGVALRCPDDLHEVSRVHAAFVAADGTVYVEDRGSANGTWVEHADGHSRSLVVGRPAAVDRGDVVWLDGENRVRVDLR